MGSQLLKASICNCVFALQKSLWLFVKLLASANDGRANDQSDMFLIFVLLLITSFTRKPTPADFYERVTQRFSDWQTHYGREKSLYLFVVCQRIMVSTLFTFDISVCRHKSRSKPEHPMLHDLEVFLSVDGSTWVYLASDNCWKVFIAIYNLDTLQIFIPVAAYPIRNIVATGYCH